MRIVADYIGKRIILLRGEMSQKDLAERASIHRVQLSKYETGKAVPSDAVLQRLAVALGCDTADIFGPGEGLQRLVPKCDEFQEKIVEDFLCLLNKVTVRRATELEELKRLRKENEALKKQIDKMKRSI